MILPAKYIMVVILIEFIIVQEIILGVRVNIFGAGG
jgi:hypothetical protein